MGEMCPPSAASYAMDAVRFAQRRQYSDGVRINQLEDRVKALEAAVLELQHGS